MSFHISDMAIILEASVLVQTQIHISVQTDGNLWTFKVIRYVVL